MSSTSSMLEIVGIALLAVVQLLSVIIHQVLSARRHQRTLGQLREEVASLRPSSAEITPVDNPLRLCLRCFHARGDHADAGPKMGGPCNRCDCMSFVAR